MRIREKVRKKIKGFTLIELLVVTGILVVLLSIVLIAINPLEQFNKTKDVATNTVKNDLAQATKYFYATEKTTPWTKNSSCRQELSTQDKVSDMPSCVQELTRGGDLQTKVINSDEAKDIFMTECSGSVALCYKPKSSSYKNNPDAKYGRNGALNSSCPGGDNCYSCDFSTNEAQECFNIMSPNADELAIAQNEAPQDTQSVPDRPSKDVCDKPQDDGRASCASKVVTNSSGTPLQTLAPPNGLSPEQLHKAYGLPCTPGGAVDWECQTPTVFGPRIIAIVVAFHATTLESDLAIFNSRYNLPPCTKANGCLTVVNQDGNTTPVPGSSTIWSSEANLDVQMAHAICQTCKILVVETVDNYFTNLTAGVRRAALMGATAISNSYGGSESSSGVQFASGYDHPGVFVVASTGDWGYGLYQPSSYTNVIGAGGTTLYMRNDNTYSSELVWNGTGGGCSALHSANSYQLNLPNWSSMGCATKKGVADVAAVADPKTGVAIYDSSGYFGPPGWHISGGTSASSPIIAAALTLQAATNTGTGAEYIYANSSKFRDINAGSNGSCGGSIKCTAGVGYDGPTGLGSPNFLPFTGITPTFIPPTPTPTPIAKNIISSSDPNYGYVIGSDHYSFTKVSTFNTNSCTMGETKYCTQTVIWDNARDNTGYVCTINNIRNAVFRKLYCNGDIVDSLPTLTPTPTITASVGAFIVNPTAKTYTKVTNYSLNGQTPIKNCVTGETITCSQTPIISGADAIGQCNIGTTGYAVFSKVSCAGIITPTVTPTATPSATPTSVPTLTPTPTPTSALDSSKEIWVQNNMTLKRMRTDGTFMTGSVAERGDSIAVVGQEVWVAWAGEIYRYNLDMTRTKPNINIGTGVQGAWSLNVVGSQVWVAFAHGPTDATGRILRFNLDGTSAGAAITNNGICMPRDISVVGTQVWVANYNGNGGSTCITNVGGSISRFNFNGTSAGSTITTNGLNGVIALSTVGNEVWVSNSSNNTISRFNFDGTPSGSVISGNSLEHPHAIAVVNNKVWVANTAMSYYRISRFNLDGTADGAVINTLGAYPDSLKDIVVVAVQNAPTPAPTTALNCATQQTVTLLQSQPILALPSDTVNNSLNIKNNNSVGCSSLLYTISSSRPFGWTLGGIPASVTVASGETKNIPFTLQVPSNATAGNYPYQFWVAKPGESSPLNTDGSVQVAQVGPTPTPSPTPVNCFQGWSNSLGSTSLSGNAGDTINQTLTITYNNPPSCGGSATFGISHSYPSGWIINGLPPSVVLTSGQTKTIQFTITISTGAQVQDYLTQYWVNSGSQPMNATIHVLATATPPEEQMFSNFNAKTYGTYALFEYSYNATGNVSGRLDFSTDPNGLNTTAVPPPPGTRYGFAFNSGNAMDASNQSNPSSVRGFIVSSPQSYPGYSCGQTIYYRMYNTGDMRIKSPVKSTVVDCTTQINVLPWDGWYPAIYQGIYDARYDADNNGVINYVDYWILVRATRLR